MHYISSNGYACLDKFLGFNHVVDCGQKLVVRFRCVIFGYVDSDFSVGFRKIWMEDGSCFGWFALFGIWSKLVSV